MVQLIALLITIPFVALLVTTSSIWSGYVLHLVSFILLRPALALLVGLIVKQWM